MASLALLVVVFASCADTDEPGLTEVQEPDQLRRILLDPPEDFFLVDTRSAGEYVAGHIPGSINREYNTIGSNLPTEDRDALIVVYCLSGVRSNRAARTLTSLGFTRVVDWGGITRWPYGVVFGEQPGVLGDE